ncbi:MAG: STAS domain-containing protein [Lentisphaerae bacterium]|nr:STAS domain-containing protein [Lentisphaerota bacterium]
MDLFTRPYSFSDVLHDLVAGLIVGVVALPLAIAFGIASGVSPTQGLATAVIAGFLISAFSGSRVQIGGPTGAFIVIIYGIVAQHGYDGLAVATLMAGVMLIIMGFAGCGSVIKYIPYPVTVGFTTGIALIIFAGQIKDLLGLHMDKVPADFIEKMLAYGRHLGTVNPLAVGIGAVTVLIVLHWKRVTQRVPGSLVAILVTTAAVQAAWAWGLDFEMETIGQRFPAVAEGMRIQAPRVPRVSLETFRTLFSPAISIALLAGIESLLSAVVADGMTGQRHHSNTELIGQGLANVVSPLFGGIPATGAIARTATNIKNGGRSSLSGIVHAVVLLLIMLCLGRWAAMIPMATLGGIVAVVAWNMSELHLFRRMFRSTRSDALVMMATFLLTVLIDLTVAIQIGMILAAFLFIRRMAEATQAGYLTRLLGDPADAGNGAPDASRRQVPKGCDVFEINGPMFFGAADKCRDAIDLISRRPQVLIFHMRHVLALDATALNILDDVFRQCEKRGTRLILAGVHSQPLVLMTRSGFLDRVGQDNVFGDIDDALNRARERLTR